MIPEIQVRNIAELTKALAEINKEFGSALPWYRGHAGADWKLIPSVHRKPVGLEQQLMVAFRMGANIRHPNCPEFSNYAAWLPLMRHSGLATRLLDWSESPLVATFFAVASEELASPAAIWVLVPGPANQVLNGSEFIKYIGNQDIAPIVQHAFVPGAPNNSVWAVNAPQTDIRMALQLSHYTIHGGRIPLEDHPDADKFLRRLVIPENARNAFRYELRLLGMSRSSVFLDLHNLAIELNDIRAAE
jgi:hypothetical protein